MLPSEIIVLALVGAVAGAINAVAGGGTILTFPTLLGIGTPPLVANATSTLALMFGTLGSLFGYRRHMKAIRPWLWRFVPVSIIGGWIGSHLLVNTHERTFARLVPFLILFATVIFLAQGAFRRFAGIDNRGEVHPHHHTVWAAVVFQFGVALYGGYFGAGIGILMLASLAFIGLSEIHEMNALKTILSALINLVASIWFIQAGLIDWTKMSVMTIGAVAGYYFGSHYSQRINPNRVRHLITVIGIGLAGLTFYKEFLR